MSSFVIEFSREDATGQIRSIFSSKKFRNIREKYDFADFNFKFLFSGFYMWATVSAMHAAIGRAKQPKRPFHRRQDLLRKRYVAAFVSS